MKHSTHSRPAGMRRSMHSSRVRMKHSIGPLSASTARSPHQRAQHARCKCSPLTPCHQADGSNAACPLPYPPQILLSGHTSSMHCCARPTFDPAAWPAHLFLHAMLRELSGGLKAVYLTGPLCISKTPGRQMQSNARTWPNCSGSASQRPSRNPCA